MDAYGLPFVGVLEKSARCVEPSPLRSSGGGSGSPSTIRENSCICPASTIPSASLSTLSLSIDEMFVVPAMDGGLSSFAAAVLGGK